MMPQNMRRAQHIFIVLAYIFPFVSALRIAVVTDTHIGENCTSKNVNKCSIFYLFVHVQAQTQFVYLLFLLSNTSTQV